MAWAWQGLGLGLLYAGIIIIIIIIIKIIIIKQLMAKVYGSRKGTLHVRGILKADRQKFFGCSNLNVF